MSKKRTKQYLMLLMVIGLVSIAAGGGQGTFASFSAETTNAGNYFASGTLYLHNTPGGGTLCKSEDQTTTPSYNYNGNCDSVITADSFDGSVIKNYVTLVDAGSLPASDIKFSVANCTPSTTDGAPAPPFVQLGVGASEFGCDDVKIVVQEVDSATLLAGHNVFCAWGTDDGSGNCDLASSTTTLASSGTPGNLQTTGATDAKLDGTGDSTPTGDPTTRYYVVEIQPDVSAFSGDANALQDVKVTFDLTWHIDQ